MNTEYSERWDAAYNPETGEWLEGKCGCTEADAAEECYVGCYARPDIWTPAAEAAE